MMIILREALQGIGEIRFENHSFCPNYLSYKAICMQHNDTLDMSSLPAIYSKRKTRKCSSCKCLKPMDQFLPIVINKKTVIPKTCQYCRSRRNSYYWSTG